MLTREQILAIDDLKEMTIEVPEWGGEIKIKGFSVAKKMAVLEAASEATGREGQTKLNFEKLQIVSFLEGVIDPKFTVADYDILKNKSAVVVQRVCDEVGKLTGVVEQKKIEEAKNDSGETPKS